MRLTPLVALAAVVSLTAQAAGEDAHAKCRAGDLRSCQAALEAMPDDIDLRRHFATHLLGQRWDDDAIVNLMEIARRRPDDPRAYSDLAAALATLNRFTEAIQPVERALAKGADDLPTLQLAAIAFRAGKRWDAVLEVSLRAAAKGDRLAMYELAELYADGMGTPADPAQALHWLDRAAAAGHIGAMDRLAEIYREGQLGQARDAAKAAAWQKRADEADGS